MDSGWLLTILLVLTPVFFVLLGTADVLIYRAVRRHRARREADEIEWERYTQP